MEFFGDLANDNFIVIKSYLKINSMKEIYIWCMQSRVHWSSLSASRFVTFWLTICLILCLTLCLTLCDSLPHYLPRYSYIFTTIFIYVYHDIHIYFLEKNERIIRGGKVFPSRTKNIVIWQWKYRKNVRMPWSFQICKFFLSFIETFFLSRLSPLNNFSLYKISLHWEFLLIESGETKEEERKYYPNKLRY